MSMSGFDQTLFISSIRVVKLTPAIVLFMTLTVFVEFLIFFLDSESHDSITVILEPFSL